MVANVTSTSFILSWRSPLTEDHNGIIRQYLINITEENTDTLLQLTSTELSTVVNFLHPFYNYTCTIAAVTIEASAYSTPITVTTLEEGKFRNDAQLKIK